MDARIRRPVRSFSIATGELLWASNQLHTAFAVVFSVLVSKKNLAVGQSIWHAVQSDSTQRNMLAEVAKVALGNQKRMHALLLWAKKKADSLATIRNDAAHMSTAFRTDNDLWALVANAIGNPPSRAVRLESRPDLLRYFRSAKSDLVQLSGFVYALLFRMIVPDANHPWPRRPVLKAA